MSIPAFRDALALMIDKEFMANNVLQGVAFPLYATVPEGNTKWYNAEAADRFASVYAGKPTADRLAEAMELLRGAGFAWEVEPTMDEAGVTVNAGSGITLQRDPGSRSWRSWRPDLDTTRCGRRIRSGSRPG